MLCSYKAYAKLYTQFSVNCNKDYQVENPVTVMVDYLKFKPMNRTNLSLLLHPTLRKLPEPGLKITVVYGDDDLYGDSPKYVRERYPTGHFITIPGSSHFPWLHNEEAFLQVLAGHYEVEKPASISFKV